MFKCTGDVAFNNIRPSLFQVNCVLGFLAQGAAHDTVAPGLPLSRHPTPPSQARLPRVTVLPSWEAMQCGELHSLGEEPSSPLPSSVSHKHQPEAKTRAAATVPHHSGDEGIGRACARPRLCNAQASADAGVGAHKATRRVPLPCASCVARACPAKGAETRPTPRQRHACMPERTPIGHCASKRPSEKQGICVCWTHGA